MSTSGEQFAVLAEKIDTLIRVIALSIVADRPRQEQCELLSGVGLSSREIAEILGTTRNTVSVALSKMKKRRQDAGGMKE